jgi:hypothetical protein
MPDCKKRHEVQRSLLNQIPSEKKEKSNEKDYSDSAYLFIDICLQQQLGQKAGARVQTLRNRPGGALSRSSHAGPSKLIIG